MSGPTVGFDRTSDAAPARRPRVLMATFHEWDSPLPLGSHHLSKAFVREGWDVAHVSSAISPPQLLRSPREFRQRMGRYKRSGVLRMDGHLWTYMPFAVLTPQSAPILRTKVVHRNWQRTTIPDVVATLASRGFGAVDILYIDTPTQAFCWISVRYTKSVARIGDRYSGFRGIADETLRMELELIRGVDVVAFSARISKTT